MSSRSDDECSKLKCNSEMNKDITSNNSVSAKTATSPDNSLRNTNSEKKKKFIIPKIFGSKRTTGRGGSSDEEEFKEDGYGFDMEELDKRMASRENAFPEASPYMRKNFSERQSCPEIEGLNLSHFEQPMAPVTVTQMRDFRVFVATWNLGGNTPYSDLNLEDFLLVDGPADIYVIGFQEIVPLNAGNVLVVEDNEPAAKWLNLINQALNKPPSDSMESDSEQGSRSSNKGNTKETKVSGTGTLPFFQKRSVKGQNKNFRVDGSLLKTCNCPVESPSKERRRIRKLSDPISTLDLGIDHDICMDELLATAEIPRSTKHLKYLHVASKQMVGIFLSIWTRRELVPHIAHLRISTVGTGIMGRLGNKGCISISMSLHQTSFCFICSHLASGEKEGDELKRNADVIEILKSTQFSKICKNPCSRAPEKIVDHDRIIWLGDLNYRVSLSYEETKVYLEENDWDTLLEKDQLNMERDAGRVFDGFNEGRILFAPTYKYSHNSDSYAGETTKSKKKRRTPAWCDRILWRGEGIEQSFYIRGESRFSDHRPVCAVFLVKVGVRTKYTLINRFRKGYSCSRPRQLEYEDCVPQRHSFYD